jgi:hypothetical protein
MAAQSPASTKLSSALAAANTEGKVLDVSALQADGTGARRIKIPKTTRGTKKWVENFPVVSDNYGSYALAMQLLGPEYAGLSAEYLRLYAGAKQVRAPKEVTVRATRRLGETIVAFPVSATAPAPVAAGAVTIVTARSPRRAKSPRAKSPRAPKSPKAATPRQAAILVLPGAVPTAVRIPSPRGTAARVPSPRRTALLVPMPPARR